MQTRLDVGMILAGRYCLASAGQVRDLGTMYRATDVGDGREVSVLVLPGGLLPGPGALGQVRGVQHAVARLANPRLVPYEHAGLIGGQAYLVRRPVGGISLAQLLAHTPILDTALALKIAASLCATLAPLHEAGLVHGSLAPDSIFLDETQALLANGSLPLVTLVDVGLLPALPAGSFVGRGPYFSPEQAAGEQVRPAADVYVVGALLYTMLTGRPPFRSHDPAVLVLQHQRQHPPALEILRPGAPPGLSDALNKALAKVPAARYRDARQFGLDLQAQRAALVPRPSPAPPPPPQSPAPGRMVVPPPPPLEEGPPRAERVSYLVDDGQNFASRERDDGNLLTVLLLILALIAVLGLIPLWRSIYRRWAVPPTAVPASESWLAPPDWMPAHDAGKLESGRFFVIMSHSAAPRLLAGQDQRSLICDPMESRLRAFNPSCAMILT